MIKIILPKKTKKKTFNKQIAYNLWNKLKLTGNMQIWENKENIEIRIEPERKISLTLIKKNLPKEILKEAVIQEITIPDTSQKSKKEANTETEDD
jgi:hypothetical protein